MKIKLGLLSLILFTACSFNKMFLRPTKLLAKNKKMQIISSKKDTSYIVFDTITHQPHFINSQNDTLQFDFTIESVVFKSNNGNLLNGWFLKPKNIVPSTTILHLHGNAGCVLSQYRAMTPLLKYGFQIFVFDYSGFGFSEGKASRSNVLIDGNSALTYLKNREDVKSTKMVVYGQSLGGHLSAVVASQNQELIDALVIEGAFSSHKDIAADMAGFLGRILVSEKYSASQSITQCKKPTLIIHSTQDETIPFKMGQKLYTQANSPKLFYEIKECHICGPRFYADSISTKINNMLQLK